MSPYIVAAGSDLKIGMFRCTMEVPETQDYSIPRLVQLVAHAHELVKQSRMPANQLRAQVVWSFSEAATLDDGWNKIRSVIAVSEIQSQVNSAVAGLNSLARKVASVTLIGCIDSVPGY